MSNKKENSSKSEKEKTKKVKGKTNSNNKSSKNKKQSKWKKVVKVILILLILAIIIGAGVIAGLFFGVFGGELKITVDDLNIKMENSVLIDINNNEIATLNGEENREIITLNEMGGREGNLPQAFVAIEDKRFFEHQGVDIKRTAGAVLGYVTKNSSYGGSSITQQLIKNATGDKAKDWTRKVKEIAKAFQIEKEMSKDQILESYLNTIPLGGGAKNVYGVKIASRYYFDKEPKDLTIAQCAYIAGINHSPNTYKPFVETPNTEKINNRTKTVLKEMVDQNRITKEQYNEAIQEVEAGLAFKEGNITSYNSLTQNEEEAVRQVARDYAKEHDLNFDVALNKIKGGGYKIYITENKELQNILDDAYTNNADWIKTKTITEKDEEGKSVKKTVQLQSAMVIIDHKTGYVVASRGVLGEKTAWGNNRVMDAGRQPGSSIKPIAVISPSLEEKLITAGTVVDDTPITVGGYTPRNDTGGFYGLMNIRYILRVSRNIPEVKMMQKLTPAKSMKYLESYGVSTITKDDEGLSLALGGVTKGISPLEMAGAYATIANGGEYIEPTFYIKVEDSNGKVVMEKKQEKHRVISEQNAYIMQSLLTEPTGTGLTGTAGATGTGANLSGYQTCGKTGTTNESTSTWFCGFTPYYTASMYFGYDTYPASKNSAPGSGTVARRWASVMKKIHKDLPSARFEKPNDIVNSSICKDSGLLAGENCSSDPRGSRVYSEMFAKGTVPSKTCNVHVKLKICKQTGKIATEFCKDVEEKVFITREDNANWQSASDAQYMAPTENCDIHTKAPDTTKPVITLKGEETVTIKIKTEYKDAGATAKDDIDGDISSKITVEIKKDGKVVNKVDTSKVGTYIITYKVIDSAGNEDIKTRTVKVVEDNTTNQKPNSNTQVKPGNNTITTPVTKKQ